VITEAITFLAIAAFWFAAPTRRDNLSGGPLSPRLRFKEWWGNLWGLGDWKVVEERDPEQKLEEEEAGGTNRQQGLEK